METTGNQSPIEIFHAYQKLPIPVKRCTDMARRIYKREKITNKKRVHLIFCSDYFIQKLNERFLSRKRPTDVLSFNYGEKEFLGEIYISLQRAKIQARRFKVSYPNEIERLFIHGMMHLLGFDHETAPDRKRMEAKEQKYHLQ